MLIVLLWGDVRKKFEKIPKELFADKGACVTGKIELYKGKEQVVVREITQIAVE